MTTALGCTPNWLEAEFKFKCPCHGSGFYISGINFEAGRGETIGIVDRLPVHLRGEVLAGLAQSAQRTGHAEESAQLVEKMLAVMSNTPYESMAKKWKANPQIAANTSLMCMNCHDAGRLEARITAVGK